ncbi:hypothetical protein V1478_007078 [Vespula squamosa]|uniref:Uncharacterized protein n=1 Tax=Vespula squamosa TaxID=30214 RepID=A0ABD2B248_VESSQ
MDTAMSDLWDTEIHNSEITLLAVNYIDMPVTSYWNYIPLHYNGNATELEITNLKATGNEDARTYFRVTTMEYFECEINMYTLLAILLFSNTIY